MRSLQITIAVVAALACGAATALAEIPLQVVADSAQVAQADSFMVEIVAGSVSEPVADLYGIGFRLHFDPAALLLADGSKGPFWDGQTVLEFSLVDSSAGFAAYSVALTAPPGLAGHGTVASFQAVASPYAPLGETSLQLVEIEAIDSGGGGIALTAIPDTVEILLGPSTVAPGGPARWRPALSIGPAQNPMRGNGGWIHYRLPSPGPAEVLICSSEGRLIRRVCLTGPATSGAISWDGRDAHGRCVAPGAYFLRLHSGNETGQGQFILVR
jgi:hypothetical protein